MPAAFARPSLALRVDSPLANSDPNTNDERRTKPGGNISDGDSRRLVGHRARTPPPGAFASEGSRGLGTEEEERRGSKQISLFVCGDDGQTLVLCRLHHQE